MRRASSTSGVGGCDDSDSDKLDASEKVSSSLG